MKRLVALASSWLMRSTGPPRGVPSAQRSWEVRCPCWNACGPGSSAWIRTRLRKKGKAGRTRLCLPPAGACAGTVSVAPAAGGDIRAVGRPRPAPPRRRGQSETGPGHAGSAVVLAGGGRAAGSGDEDSVGGYLDSGRLGAQHNLYAALGIGEYWLYDPQGHRPRGEPRVQGFRQAGPGMGKSRQRRRRAR